MATFDSTAVRLKTGEEITVRCAEGNDAEALLEMTRSVIAEGRHHLTKPEEFNATAEEEKNWIHQVSQSPNRLILLAEIRGEIIGMLDFHGGEKKRLRHTGSLGMSVQKNWRNRGVGSVLLAILLKWASNHPELRKICLEVFADNEGAIGLYRKAGFRTEGRLVHHVRMEDGSYTDLIQMCRFV
ncbi:RimJ/RimL family protein N-acetyltransferase [Melghirimyces profundicolus]|uniref:RimJ/RimL family protein N-acetyltransferase n=1 Tax=Melghirimyces profundicolus TaxID=1242148 RepID=A0A2T6B867_9BACL|nr:GNAT family N-acetyltransferase [Melghirimyces profundicolus]PTX52218.1 RimJ/RimL family protein N-acetyltransferase [Melghirimyces profundicolus]